MKVARLIFGIFFALGVGFLIGSYFTVRHTRHFLQVAVSAPGVVVENIFRESSGSRNQGPSYSYYPRIHFQTAENLQIDFVAGTGSNPPSYSVNEPVTVLYDPQQPYNASLNSFFSLWGATIVLVILGVAFTAPGIGWFVWKSAGDAKHAWLEKNGQRIQAEITGVAPDTSLTVNGSHPYRIHCQWLDPSRNEVHVFQSGHIWFNPSRYITGKTLDVLVDPNNPHRYAVETSFLPKVV